MLHEPFACLLPHLSLIASRPARQIKRGDAFLEKFVMIRAIKEALFRFRIGFHDASLLLGSFQEQVVERGVAETD